MALVTFNEDLKVNIAEIDEQHKKLIAIINELHDAMLKGKSRDILQKVLNDLVDYTKVHFSTEEKLFAEYQYPDFYEHKQIHDALYKRVIEIQDKYQSGNLFISLEIMDFLKDWLVKHILGTDKKYSAFFNSKGVI